MLLDSYAITTDLPERAQNWFVSESCFYGPESPHSIELYCVVSPVYESAVMEG